MKMDLTKVKLEDLVKEVENRKKKIIPEIVERINKDIKLLKDLGTDIADESDCDYILVDVKVNSEGTVEFTTNYR